MEKKQTLEKKIDELTNIVNGAFDNVITKDDLKDIATKDDIRRVEDRLIKLENNHEQRITNLEDGVRIINTKIGLKK